MDAIIPNPTIVTTIQRRRTIKEFRSDPIPEETLWRILDAARWAPNHRLTEPWRVAIIGKQSREALADALANLTASSRDPSVMAKAKDELGGKSCLLRCCWRLPAGWQKTRLNKWKT
ncbi:MAG: nitroreductase family protein [Verrucomicrobia bacterium]|nr:nitroreductase family protein [Verrucomicrobiota bacterium]